MSNSPLENIGNKDAIQELTQAHPIILDTPEVNQVLRELRTSIKGSYSQVMLDIAISAAIKNVDSSQVAQAFREFAERVKSERQKSLDHALSDLAKNLNLGSNEKKPEETKIA